MYYRPKGHVQGLNVMKGNPIIGQGIFLNDSQHVVQWAHLQKGYTPRGDGWINQRKVGQPQCWHRLVVEILPVNVRDEERESQLASNQVC
jgi:hypothetical protein